MMEQARAPRRRAAAPYAARRRHPCRPLTRGAAPRDKGRVKREASGTVVEVHGIKATVLVDHSAEGERVRCRPMRGRRRLTPVVGDRVRFAVGRHGAEIVHTDERARSVVRPVSRHRPLWVATHVDRLVIVGATDPGVRPGLVDRVLCAVDDDIDVLLAVNKVDLGGADEARSLLSPFEALGYTVALVSAHSGEGVEALRATLSEGLSVVMGHSGVGKSTLLNRLVPGATLPVAGVNEKTGKGRHTTTVSTCHAVGAPWPEGGLIVDTPGIRSFPLHGLTALDVAQRFPELRRARARCRFSDCLHEGEPECVVAAAVEAGHLARDRYEAYLAVLAQIREEQQR